MDSKRDRLERAVEKYTLMLEQNPCLEHSLLHTMCTMVIRRARRALQALTASKTRFAEDFDDFITADDRLPITLDAWNQEKDFIADLKIMHMWRYTTMYSYAYNRIPHMVPDVGSSAMAQGSSKEDLYSMFTKPNDHYRLHNVVWWENMLEHIFQENEDLRHWEKHGFAKSKAPPSLWTNHLINILELMHEGPYLWITVMTIRDYLHRHDEHEPKMSFPELRAHGQIERIEDIMTGDLERFDSRVPHELDGMDLKAIVGNYLDFWFPIVWNDEIEEHVRTYRELVASD